MNIFKLGDNTLKIGDTFSVIILELLNGIHMLLHSIEVSFLFSVSFRDYTQRVIQH